ncbi:MAG TPA: MFS transporter [Chloroflexota bacterium]|nr:MFS transporter [Chloroflexota bacterium]
MVRGRLHYAWVVVAVTFLAIFVSSGVRSSFGVYVKPLEEEFGWDRAAVSGVAALSLLLYGVAQPLVGSLVDRFGSRAILTGSLVLLGVGALGSALIHELWQLYLTYGLFVSLASGGPSTVTVSAIAAHWFLVRRGLVVGVATSGISAGQLLLIPVAMWLTVHFGWRLGYVALAVLLLAVTVPLVWLLVRNDPAELGWLPFGASPEESTRTSQSLAATAERSTRLGEAARTLPFWLLAGSYFICGYSTSGLVGTHVVPYAIEHGIAEMAAASALGLMGAVNTLGAVAAGYVADRYGRRNPLAITYFLRGLSLLWLTTVQDARALHVFAILFGLSYIATVPPTTALTADLFGRRSVASIFGWIFLAHQVGSALGAQLGGVLYDLSGDYLFAFLSGGLACFAAGAMVLAIRPARPPVAVPAAP